MLLLTVTLSSRHSKWLKKKTKQNKTLLPVVRLFSYLSVLAGEF